MLEKSKFIQVINLIEEYEKEKNALSQAGFPAWDMHILDYFSSAIDLYLKEHFDEFGLDCIYWWLYEAKRNNNEIWDEDGSALLTETVDNLWDLAKEYMI